MRVLLDCLGLRSAGGLTVGHGICGELTKRDADETWILLSPERCGYEQFHGRSTQVVSPIRYLHNGWLWMLRERWVQKQIERYRPDAIFSLCNIPLKTQMPQLTLLQWPYAVYPDSPVWQRMRVGDRCIRTIRLRLFRSRLRYADCVTVQTSVMQERLLRYYPISTSGVVVVPSAGMPRAYMRKRETPENWRWIGEERRKGVKFLVYLTRYYEHKNLEVLPDVAARLAEKDAGVRILITLDGSQSQKVKRILKTLDRLGDDRCLTNLGAIDGSLVDTLLETVDGVLMPTLLESFGLPYYEAMRAGVPIFTSDLDFARVTCREAAFYFNPHDADDICRVIRDSFAKPEEIAKKVRIGQKYYSSSLDWDGIVERYTRILRELARRRAG